MKKRSPAAVLNQLPIRMIHPTEDVYNANLPHPEETLSGNTPAGNLKAGDMLTDSIIPVLSELNLAEIKQLAHRIEVLSKQPEYDGLSTMKLEKIHDLITALIKRLEGDPSPVG